ncbi:mandelate racemase/muconate lactonizing enzyme family protein [Hathewaya limosa]|uniref:Dipeptide epimerase n=1 Tax=Hathewaya limosa TaxID=1536 RepID=A0ABU0JSB9_HATLI|nr:dipeptide epimerase [Hathewaya limosa]MDQ0479974.1 L-alanine-DL-glutamate epimerase-like enolase superfamily enzyme [Hathewaya limosa]
MRIKDIEVGKIRLPLNTEYSLGVERAKNPKEIVIKVITDTGEIGIGSAAATPNITGDIEASIIGAIHFIKPYILDMNIDCRDEIMHVINKNLVHNNSAKAAIDMAIYDLFCKKYGIPLYKLLGGYGYSIGTDITINYGTVEEMVTKSVEASMGGCDCLKIKIGYTDDVAGDLERVFAIKKAVKRDTRIRIDGNQGWGPKEAVKIIRRIENMGLDIEFVEQPVKAWDFEGLKYVTDHVDTDILADESVMGPPQAFKIINARGADLIGIKLMKCGGIHNAMKIYSMAETMGIKCMMGCMIESRIGITAAASFAVARGNMIKSDLDTMLRFSHNPIIGGVSLEKDILTLPDKPGLGIEEVRGWEKIEL